MSRSAIIRGVGLVVFTVCLEVGCGGSDGWGQRIPVSGTVTLDGQPLETGTISFIPLKEGPPAQAEITNGAYSISRSEGPGPGPHRVEIHSIVSTGEEVFIESEGVMMEQTKNLVAPKYNVASTLQVNISAESDKHDFRVNSPTKTAKKAARRGR